MSESRDSNRLRIGTRGSALARWQATWVTDRLRELHPGLEIELIEVHTLGDRDRNSPLARIGGEGLFTKEIQLALLDNRVDVAVHSLKDLPTRGPDELILAAVPPREGTDDALIAPQHELLDRLPPGARVGTGSLRRKAQLAHLRPDLEIVGVRGNIETRLNLALQGDLDAVMLAGAGLRRLGLDHHITEHLGPPRFLPAVGQGALGIECRRDDSTACELLQPLDDAPTHALVRAERSLLAALGGGCLLPLGVWARIADNTMKLDAVILSPDGRDCLTASATGALDELEVLGQRVAALLRDQGADRILEAVKVAQ